ncbi:MAG TPA: LamG-like jellyroll fold domain-containing protein, partial [Bryobacteraceae bacterium]|nr:LamG-like jellyroll fold domain-containing protein [Bryobacteraceae bacterium]
MTLAKSLCTIFSAIFLFTIAGSAPASALTPPIMTVSDSLGDSVTIDSAGTVMFGGSCTSSSCVTESGGLVISQGSITWSGVLHDGTNGGLQFVNFQGMSKPTLASPQLSLGGRVNNGTGAPVTVTVQWSDIGFSTAAPPLMISAAAGTAPLNSGYTGPGTITSASFNAYVDSTNALNGQQTPVNTISFSTVSSATQSSTAYGPAASGNQFSMTQIETFTMSGAPGQASYFFNNFTLMPVAPPVMTINDSLGDSVTIDSNGVVAFGGGCTPSTCATNSGGLTISPGTIKWSGLLHGDTHGYGLQFVNLQGMSKPALGSPQMSVGGRVNNATGAPVTVNIEWSDTGFGSGGPPGTLAAAAGTAPLNSGFNGLGTASNVSFNAYVDSTGVLNGQQTPVNNISFNTVSSDTQSSTVTGPGPGGDPFSMTQVETFTMSGATGQASYFFNNFTLMLSPVSIRVSPLNTILLGGQTQQFAAAVLGASNTEVNWTVSPAGAGTITASGMYTAPGTVATQTTVTVTATSQADSTKTATATIILAPPLSVIVSPQSTSLVSGQTQQLTATVSGLGNTAVNWSATEGTISTTGLYTAPPNINTVSTVLITATSQVDSLQYGLATVTLNPPISLTVLPGSSSLGDGQTLQFVAVANGSSTPAVNWSISDSNGAPPGSISATGLYTAPSTIAVPATVTVTATSSVDGTKTATATLMLDTVSVALSPLQQMLIGGQTLQFTTTVTGTNNTGVFWILSSGNGLSAGSISATGLYTAPATVTDFTPVSLQAVSVADSTQSDQAGITLVPPITSVTVVPLTTTLAGGQTQQFTAAFNTANSTNNSGAMTWTISPANAGTVDPTGFYNAPATVNAPLDVTVTATSNLDTSKSGRATITLVPTQVSPTTITVSPLTSTLAPGQTQQFAAAVTGLSNASVNWSISPSTAGSISATGLYSAPATPVASPQSVTVKATSIGAPAMSASATVTLISAPAINNYSHRRPIVIDHTKVPNTDQLNFPVLISGVYGFLANVASGGEVQNGSGYDIVFSSDCAGLQRLNHQIESYDPVTGTLNMWVQLPLVSHTTDTVFYISYGNSTVTTSQENRTGVWDGNYQMILHLGEMAAPYPDSTANSYTSTGGTSPAASAGKIGGGQSFDGATQYIAWSQTQSPNPTGAISLETWIKTTDTPAPGSPAKGVFGKWESDGAAASDQSYEIVYHATGQPSGFLEQDNATPAEADSAVAINDGNWHHLALTASANGAVAIYIDGVQRGSRETYEPLLSTTPDRLLAGATTLAAGANYMRGSLDEIRISNSARSADWIATGFNNQNSPSTFYTIYPEDSNSLAPGTSRLSSSQLGTQTQQFTALFTAGAVVSNQTNPLVLLGTAATPSGADSVAINGNLAYVCDNNEISIIDITDAASPVFLSSFTSSYIVDDGFAHCSIQQGALAEFADETSTQLGDSPAFLAFGLQTPTQPQLIQGTAINKRFFTSPPVYAGNTAFLPTYSVQSIAGSWINQTGDIVAVDISNLSNPLLLGTLETPGDAVYGGGNAVFGAATANATTLLVGGSTSTGASNDGAGQLLAVDISNPTAMNVVAQLPVPGTIQVFTPVIQDTIAVSMGDSAGFVGSFPPNPGGNLVLTIFNISNPRAPGIVSSTVLPYSPAGIGSSAQIGTNLFLFGGVVDSSNNNYVLLVNTTNPIDPAVTAYPVTSPISYMTVVGNILHTTSAAGYATYQIPGTTSSQDGLSASCSGPVTWSIAPSGFGVITPTGPQAASYAAPASVSSQQAVTVTATSVDDATQTATATVTVYPLAESIQTTLSMTSPAPSVVHGVASFLATVTDQSGNPAPAVNVIFTVTGSNPQTATVLSDQNGHASFTYTGLVSGTDSVTAAPPSTGGTGAGPLSAFWINARSFPATTAVNAQFFTANSCASGCEAFTTPTTQSPAFTQTFPDLNFASRPFIDSTFYVPPGGAFPFPDGRILAASAGFQAGNASLTGFSAVFRGNLVVAQTGSVTFNVNSGDGFIFGVGNGATPVSGIVANPPATGTTVFSGYPLMAANNGPWDGPVPIVVSFPAAGSYPYEIDYQSGSNALPFLQLQLQQNGSLETVPPLTVLVLSEDNTTELTGTADNFYIQAYDENGAPATQIPVNLTVSGANPQILAGTTDSNGQLTLTYAGTAAGTDFVQATATIHGFASVSNQDPISWFANQSAVPTIQVSGDMELNLPNPGFYAAQVTDPVSPAGGNISVAWSQVSGPGPVTFSAAQQAFTTVTYPVPGVYTLKVTATDSLGSASLTVGPITIDPPIPVAPSSRWIQTPTDHATVTGLVPIVLIPTESLTSGTLSYFPMNNPDAVTILNANTTGSGTLATLDTTQLANGSWYVYLAATDANGATLGSGVEIQVAGSYKPGRVTTTVTDLVVPAPGLPIQIQRTYDSLVRSTSSDFGYGWSLGVDVQLDVSPKHDVTITINGQRRTFYFTPYVPGYQLPGIGNIPPAEIPNLLGVYLASYTPEPGFYGTLTLTGTTITGTQTGCALDWLMPNGDGYICYADAGTYNPAAYVYTDPYGRAYTIAANGGLQSIKDPAGNTLTVTPNGISSTNGLSVPFARDSSGRITQITDTLGNVYQYGYDSNGNLASVAYPGPANPTTYTYDATHNYAGGTDPRGNALPATTYDSSGRLKSITDALGQTTGYAYDLTSNTTTITNPADANGQTGTVKLIHDSYGMVLTSTDPLGNTTTNTYDANHDPTSVTDPLGHTTTYAYDSSGNRTSVTHPMTPGSVNTTSTTVYNQFGEPTQTTDELGNVTAFTYDANFWPKLASDGIGPVVSFTFNANGTQAAKAAGYDLTQNSGAATTYTYDSHGNLASQTDALGRQTQYAYDTLGRLSSTTPPAPSAPTTYVYDTLGNTKTITAPLGRVTSYTYDSNSNKIGETDANGNAKSYQYDALNRLTQVTYPTNPATTTSYTYDFRNNVIDTVDQLGRTTHNVYDLAGRLISTTSAYGTANPITTTSSWYADGRKATDTDARGNTTTYTYDAAGRLTGVLDAQLNTTSYGYDDAGDQISVTDPNVHKTQSLFDARRRLTKTTYDNGTTTVYAYDGAGNLTSVTDQASNTVNYTYDLANQLNSVVQPASPNAQHTSSYGYDPNGNLTGITDANSHTTADGFDFLNQLVSETLPAGPPTQTRTYDAAGNLTSLTDYNGKKTTYAYDSLNRLITTTPDTTTGDATVSFTYTATGRRATMSDASGTTTYGYDNLDRLITKATPEGTLTYTYDAAGNLASMASSNANGASVAYTWDQLNRLSSVVDNRLPAGQNTTYYSYDPASNVATVTYPNGVQSTFTYDDLNRVTGLNATRSTYAYTLGPTGNR